MLKRNGTGDGADSEITLGGGEGVDIDETPEDPDEIGGPPPVSSTGGSVSGGSSMFQPQNIGMPGMGDPALLAPLQFPVEDFLAEYGITKGLFGDYIA